MSQPASKLGPVTFGGSAVFANSQPGVFNTLAEIQGCARGGGEWIDGLATSGAPAPEFAHDHRGGVWGRPLGVGHCVPMVGQAAQTFLNVPDVSSPTGEAFPTIQQNGGYQYVDLYVFQNAAAATYLIKVESSQWINGLWAESTLVEVPVASPGGAASWVKTVTSFQLPPGLIRLKLSPKTSLAGWEWSAFVIPQR